MPSKVLAETIVNAFCSARRNKSMSNLFIPSFLVRESDASVHMYNCNEDKLITSAPLPLWRKHKGESVLNINTILYIWIALHFDVFDTSCTNKLQEHFPKSKFQTVVGDQYEIYRNKSRLCLYSSNEKAVVQNVRSFQINPTIQIDDSRLKKRTNQFEKAIAQLRSSND